MQLVEEGTQEPICSALFVQLSLELGDPGSPSLQACGIAICVKQMPCKGAVLLWGSATSMQGLCSQPAVSVPHVLGCASGLGFCLKMRNGLC